MRKRVDSVLAIRRFLNLGLLVSIEVLYYLYYTPRNALFFLFWCIVGTALTLVALLRGTQNKPEESGKKSDENILEELIHQADFEIRSTVKENKKVNQMAIWTWVLFDIINVMLYLMIRT